MLAVSCREIPERADPILELAFDRVGVSYALQNQMIALLAPMQRDIVKR